MVNKYWKWGSVVGIMTVLLAERSGARIPVGERDFSVLRNVQTGSGTHPASCSVGTEVHFQGQSGRGVQLIIHLHIVPRLGMNENVPLLPLYVWTGKTFSL